MGDRCCDRKHQQNRGGGSVFRRIPYSQMRQRSAQEVHRDAFSGEDAKGACPDASDDANPTGEFEGTAHALEARLEAKPV